MRFRGIVLTIVVVVALFVAALDWGELTKPVPVRLLVATPQWPLGLILLVTLVALVVLFFLAALVDRAGQLRQLTRSERQAAALRARLEAHEKEEASRLEGLLDAAVADLRARVGSLSEGLERRLDSALEAVEKRLTDRIAGLESRVQEALAAMEARDRERLAAVSERIVTLRDELAADIAQAEDALARRMAGDGAEPEPPG